jgi:hypothetical protein
MDDNPAESEYPDLSHLADEEPLLAIAAPTADTLERIVDRARRGRMRTVVVTVVAAALVGSAAGVLVARNTSSTSTSPGGTEVNTAGQPGLTPTIPAISPAGVSGAIREGGSSGGGYYGDSLGSLSRTPFFSPFSVLFLRTTADGIAIRAYEPKGTTGTTCSASFGLMAEFSDNLVAGSSVGISFTGSSSSPVEIEQASVAGEIEGAPIWLVFVKSTPAVARVVAHFPDGSSDQMAMVKGWAVLAHRAIAGNLLTLNISTGTLQAFGSHGQGLATVPLKAVPLPAVRATPPTSCVAIGSAIGSASSSSASASGAGQAPAGGGQISATTTIAGSAATSTP